MTAHAAMLVAVLAGMGSAGCAGIGDSAVMKRMLGTCDPTYRSGIVVITAAQSTGGTAGPARTIPQVTLNQIMLNDRAVDPGDVPGLVNAYSAATGLVCSVPCSFGTADGKWQFTAYAPGHAGRPVSVGAHYALIARGCPAYHDKGTELRLSLEPR